MRQRLAIILAIGVVILLLLTLFRERPESRIPVRQAGAEKPKEEIAAATEARREPIAVAPKKAEAPAAVAPKVEAEEWGEDPFVRDFSFLAEIKDLRLTAITISESKSYALINDQILTVGDEVAGKKVVEIQKDKVVVEKGGRRFTILFGQ